jgi:hypothetical protein
MQQRECKISPLLATKDTSAAEQKRLYTRQEFRLDRIILFGERSLCTIARNLVGHHQTDRNHLLLQNRLIHSSHTPWSASTILTRQRPRIGSSSVSQCTFSHFFRMSARSAVCLRCPRLCELSGTGSDGSHGPSCCRPNLCPRFAPSLLLSRFNQIVVDLQV